MVASTPVYLNCRAEIVRGLVEVAAAALLGEFPKLLANPYDIELIVDAMHVLRPEVLALGILDGTLHIAVGRWDEAVRVLRQVSDALPHFSYAKSLLAFCLAVRGDQEWRLMAAEAAEIDPEECARVMQALEARADLINAIHASRAGGNFVVPPSVEALKSSSEAHEGSEPAVRLEAHEFHQPHFLRG